MTTNGPNDPPSDGAQNSFPGASGYSCPPTGANSGEFGALSRRMLSRLSQTIEGDIIPRLMLAFDTSEPRLARQPGVSERLNESVDEFVQLLLRHDASVAVTYISTLRSDGIPLAALYLDLLSPAARRLGDMWEQDLCSFTDVTIGVCRMHQVLLEFSRCFDARAGAGSDRDALIVPVPGEQHTFGIFMVMEFLRRAGWHCWSGSPATRSDIRRLVRAQDFDVIGVSVSSDVFIDRAAELIDEIRKGPRNAETVILVGGRAVLENPDLATELGADAMARDGRDAVQQLDRLCRQSTGRST